jgi:alpha-mannosidase
LIVDCIKRAEDDADATNGWLPAKSVKKSSDRHVVLRVYDSLGGRSRGTIGFGPVKVAKAWKCNVLEDELEEVKIGNDGLEIEMRAFEVATFKFLLA